jgi:hypothetical protein
MDGEARVPRQPGLHFGVLVCGVVVEHDMDDFARPGPRPRSHSKSE